MPTKEGFMTPKELEDYCNDLLDAYGVPRDLPPISDEEFQRIMKKCGSLSDEVIKMREEQRSST